MDILVSLPPFVSQTSRSFEATGEAFDVESDDDDESEVYSSAAALGLARLRAPVPEHGLPVLGLCLRPPWMQHSLFSLPLLFLLVRVALNLRSLRFHSLRLFRTAVLLLQTNASLFSVPSSSACNSVRPKEDAGHCRLLSD